jgi:4-hydroxy-tetrahydrodipicolinate reductase
MKLCAHHPHFIRENPLNPWYPCSINISQAIRRSLNGKGSETKSPEITIFEVYPQGMKLRIALFGYGKMGQAVEQQAIARGHLISHRVSLANPEVAAQMNPTSTDVVIEFTEPDGALANCKSLLAAGLPVVTGTTGWESHLHEVKQMVQELEGSFMYSSNFSPGMNIMFRLNETLAKLMNAFPEYDVMLHERHHRHKKDAPGGTALHLANQLLENLDAKKKWVNAELAQRPPEADELSLSWVRAGEITGEHEVTYVSAVDQISIRHEAFNRNGFALGAVLAAEWLHGKRGFYHFSEVFK